MTVEFETTQRVRFELSIVELLIFQVLSMLELEIVVEPEVVAKAGKGSSDMIGEYKL